MAINLTSETYEPEMLRFTHTQSLQAFHLAESSPSAAVESQIPPPDGIVLHAPEVAAVLGLSILGFFLMTIVRVMREDKKAAQAGIPVPPCSSCRFYSKNVYLKCAVHPSDALTERAVHCPDYCPCSPEQTKNPHSWLK